MSSNLSAPVWVLAQGLPGVTVNVALRLLERSLTESHTCDVTAGNVSVTSVEYAQNIKFICIGTAIPAGRTVTVPMQKRLAVFKAAASNNSSIALLRGSTSITLAPGAEVLVYTDGTANGLVATPIIGAPAGGTTGQILVKVSGTNFDIAFAAANSATHPVPAGGTTGQVLVKLSNADQDINWQNHI